MRRSELAGSLYDLVTGDEDARVCKDIPDAACNDQPENFFLYAGIREQPGATEGGGNAGREALASLSILVSDAPFRRFVITRALLVAAGIASTVSSGFWGRMADRSSRDVLRLAATVAGLLSLVVAGWAMAGSPGLPSGVVVVGAFFIIGIAHAGIRIGRKTYLVDMANAQTRATYVAVSNTAIGVVLLAGALGATRLDEVTR